VLNNKIFKDNRIPPIGFTNAAFADFGGAPVEYSYADGQYWDVTDYAIPPGAVSATVTLYYQSTSKEFIEFLLSENGTNTKGQELYDLWNNNDKCPPQIMAQTQVAVQGQDQYTLTVNVTGQGGVDLDPPDGTYLSGTTVQLTANADPGWSFDHWEGDLSGSTNPESILMDSDKTVTAVFLQDQYTLTVNITGQGSVDLDPPGGTYLSGTPVQLTANADPGWHFEHWEGDLSGSTNPESILMDSDKTVTAVFVQDQYTLTVNITGQGSVDLDPPGGTYLSGTTVQLTANADPDWQFDHWEGDLSGSNNPESILMDGDKTVTAVFVSAADCPGDLNGDGFRNVSDFTLFAAAFGSQLGDPDYNPDADLDGNGIVNVTDFTQFAGVYGVPCP
jgi:hypothetical protein